MNSMRKLHFIGSSLLAALLLACTPAGGDPKPFVATEVAAFEDGDALFVAHRQQMRGDAPHARVGFVEDVTSRAAGPPPPPPES